MKKSLASEPDHKSPTLYKVAVLPHAFYAVIISLDSVQETGYLFISYQTSLSTCLKPKINLKKYANRLLNSLLIQQCSS